MSEERVFCPNCGVSYWCGETHICLPMPATTEVLPLNPKKCIGEHCFYD